MSMQFKGMQMIYLGTEKKRNKDEKEYYLAKFMDGGASIFEFYVGPMNHNLHAKIDTLEQMKPVHVDFEVSSYNMKPQINIISIDDGKYLNIDNGK